MSLREQNAPQGFDLRVTFRDDKTGQVTHTNPYTMRVVAAADGGKTRIFERPVGSGNMWNKKGEPIGRWEGGKFLAGEKHLAFTLPETKDQILARSVVEKDNHIAQLERELASIRNEAQPKVAAKKEQGS
jgi:hypothetical protein